MKAKLLFTLFLCSLLPNVWANPDIITWEGEARWMVWSLYREYPLADGSREYRTDQYFFGKDTTIGTNTYWEVFWRKDCDVENEVSAGYALREDSARVYVYDYVNQKEHVFFVFSLKENDVLAMDWIKETDTRKNPVFRVLDAGDTILSTTFRPKYFHYIKVYDTVHKVTDMWLSRVGSVSYGIAWHRDFGSSLDTLETILCTNGGNDYKNPEYTSCYISGAEPEYVSCTGKLTFAPTPTLSFPELDCCYKAIAIKWGELIPILCFNSTWAYDGLPLQVQGVEYMEGDSVEVEGYVSTSYDLEGWLYSELKLENIRKIGATPVERQPKAGLKLTPNPAKETITLSASGCSLQRVEILDANGRVLYAATLNNTDSFRYNVSWMPSGIYLARVKTPCGVLTEKFSVK